MSGGIAYVLDRDGDFLTRCNLGTVELEQMTAAGDIAELKQLIEQHLEATGSTVAKAILDDWENSLTQFVKVMPIDYKRVLAERMKHDEEEEAPLHNEATQQAN